MDIFTVLVNCPYSLSSRQGQGVGRCTIPKHLSSTIRLPRPLTPPSPSPAPAPLTASLLLPHFLFQTPTYYTHTRMYPTFRRISDIIPKDFIDPSMPSREPNCNSNVLTIPANSHGTGRLLSPFPHNLATGNGHFLSACLADWVTSRQQKNTCPRVPT